MRTLAVAALLVGALLAPRARAGDERPSPAASTPAPPAAAAPTSCQCGGNGQCCGGQMPPAAAAQATGPRQAGSCGCAQARRDAERK